KDGTLSLGAGGSLSSTGTVNTAASGAGFDISAAGNQVIGSLSGAAGSTVTSGGTTTKDGTLSLGAGGSLSSTGTVNTAASGAGFDISAAGNQVIGSLS
ncbi:hypothetical protein, partial [Caballeronia sp. M23-90]